MRDIGFVAGNISHTLGIDFDTWTIQPEVCRYGDSEDPYAFKIAIATIGNSKLELISPTGGESHLNDHLTEKGEGYHHSGIAYSDYGAFEVAKTGLLQQGYLSIQSGKTKAHFEFDYSKLASASMIIELLWVEKMPESDGKILNHQN